MPPDPLGEALQFYHNLAMPQAVQLHVLHCVSVQKT